MNLKNRLLQLEKNSGAHDVYKYTCVIFDGWAARMDSPEESAKGYKVQPCIPSFGGNGGDPFYLQTEAELNEFAARPDVDLTIIRVGVTAASEMRPNP